MLYVNAGLFGFQHVKVLMFDSGSVQFGTRLSLLLFKCVHFFVFFCKLGRLESLGAYWNVNSPMYYKQSWQDVVVS